MKINNEKYQIALDNREIEPPKRNETIEKIRTIIISGVLSLLLIIVILITLPLTVLSWSGLFVYSSIVSLVIFLFILLIRYFATLFMAYFYLTKYTIQEKGGYFPFVSIIVPVYNEGKVLRDSIESLLELDYPNYEVIVVSDKKVQIETPKVKFLLTGKKRTGPAEKRDDAKRGIGHDQA